MFVQKEPTIFSTLHMSQKCSRRKRVEKTKTTKATGADDLPPGMLKEIGNLKISDRYLYFQLFQRS